MTPTLVPGDLVLVRHGMTVSGGVIVLARFRSRPELAVIKRAVRERDGGWLLASDNPRAGSDSRQYGVADVEACARWILRRGQARAGRWRHWWPTRVDVQFRPPG